MAGTIDIAGTVSTITSKPSDEGGAIHTDTIEDGEYDAKTQVDTGGTGGLGGEFFQELNLFAGEMVKEFTLPSGRTALVLLRNKINAMLEQPIDGSSRVYEQ